MKVSTPLVHLAVAAAGAAAFCGCGPQPVIQIPYERPAEYQIPARVKRLGLAEFTGQTALAKKWGRVASDRLEAELDAHNRKYKRYELVDRKRLKKIMDDRDLALYIDNSASAGKVGKLAGVDAMIYGNVTVAASDDRVSKPAFDLRTQSMKTVYYTKRHVIAAANFTLNDTGTGKTLTTVSATHEYDSEKDKSKSKSQGIKHALGIHGDALAPTNEVINLLIDRCVADFIAKISPHVETASEKLKRSRSQRVATGNKLAAAGEYDEALACYQAAMQESPDDHAAVFNAGVMHELLGHLKQAEAHYDKAWSIQPEEQYVRARKRVRVEKQQ